MRGLLLIGLLAALLAVTAAGCGGGSDFAVLSGTVTYMVRSALPDDAQIEVRLVAADAPDNTVNETSFSNDGQQQPLPFEVEYDPEDIDESQAYGLVATIEIEGNVAFQSAAPVPVLTQGAPSDNVEVPVEPVG
jgi:uncharacterized lipoprotein YbaY